MMVGVITLSPPSRRATVLAVGLFVLAEAGAVGAIVAALAGGVGVGRLLGPDFFFITADAICGLTFPIGGVLVAWYRPGNPIGWLFVGFGFSYALGAAGFGLMLYGAAHGWPHALLEWVVTVAMYAWPWALGLCLPLALLLFPDGRLLSRRWRIPAAAAFVAGPLFALQMGSAPDGGTFPLPDGGTLAANSRLSLGFHHHLDPLWMVVDRAIGVLLLIGLVSLVLRYRLGSETVRRQLLWLVLAVLVVVVVLTLPLQLPGSPALPVALIPVIPLAMTVAIVRYQLFDIRLVVARSVLYLVLTAGVIGGYLGLVALLDTALRRQVGLGSSVAATVLIAVAFNPVRVWMQRLVDRMLYGARQDPVRAVAAVGASLGDMSEGLDGVLEALCRVLRLPAASVTVAGREVAAFGTLPAVRHAISLRQAGGPSSPPAVGAGRPLSHPAVDGGGFDARAVDGGPAVDGGGFDARAVDGGPGVDGGGLEMPAGDRLGELVVGLRGGESRLDRADERILTLLAAPLAVAVRATVLSAEVQQSRERLVVAREEERRRLRRDLHDGLGPALTGVVLKADVARRLTATDPVRAAALMAELRGETTAAIEDVRRLVHELRPPTLDGLGLVGALREQSLRLSHRVDGAPLSVAVEAGADLPALPAAVEVAAYRIATEALTNVARHSTASTATVQLSTQDSMLLLDVSDDGGPDPGRPWKPGTGLTSMRERATELGGTCEAGYDTGRGGRVRVRFPLERT